MDALQGYGTSSGEDETDAGDSGNESDSGGKVNQLHLPTPSKRPGLKEDELDPLVLGHEWEKKEAPKPNPAKKKGKVIISLPQLNHDDDSDDEDSSNFSASKRKPKAGDGGGIKLLSILPSPTTSTGGKKSTTYNFFSSKTSAAQKPGGLQTTAATVKSSSLLVPESVKRAQQATKKVQPTKKKVNQKSNKKGSDDEEEDDDSDNDEKDGKSGLPTDFFNFEASKKDTKLRQPSSSSTAPSSTNFITEDSSAINADDDELAEYALPAEVEYVPVPDEAAGSSSYVQQGEGPSSSYYSSSNRYRGYNTAEMDAAPVAPPAAELHPSQMYNMIGCGSGDNGDPSGSGAVYGPTITAGFTDEQAQNLIYKHESEQWGNIRPEDGSLPAIKDVSVAQALGPNPRANILKTMTKAGDVPRMSEASKKKDGPTKVAKRKHQITYLAFQAKEAEEKLKDQWANNKYSRRQTAAKYGF